MHYYRMFFEEEPNSNGYASKLEAYRTDDYSVIIAIQPNDEDDAMLCQSIELNALDIRALADELNRLANEIDEEAKDNSSCPEIAEPETEQSMPKQKETKGNSDWELTPTKKNTADVHARYVKNGNGQMELMTAN